MKERFPRKAVILVLLSFTAYNLLGRIFCTLPGEYSLGQWLFGHTTGQHRYLYGWLLHQNWFWISMGVCLGGALLKKQQFASISTWGFGLGFLVGELFGEPAKANACNTNNGWWMWLCIFLASMVIGTIVQFRSTHKNSAS